MTFAELLVLALLICVGAALANRGGAPGHMPADENTNPPPPPPHPYRALPPQPRGTERIAKRWNPKKESGGR